MRDRIEKLKGHSLVMLNGYFGLRASIEVFKPTAYERSVVERHNDRGNLARSFGIIRDNLLYSCILGVTRLAFDDDTRSPSVRNLIEALRDKGIRDLLRADFTRPESFDDVWGRVEKNWTNFQGQPWVDPFLSIRDKWIAHLEVRKVGSDYETLNISAFDLKWGHPEEAGKLLHPLVLDLVLLIRNEGHVVSHLIEAYEKAGRAFWGCS